MIKRFSIELAHEHPTKSNLDVYIIIDNEREKWKSNHPYIQLRMKEGSAEDICEILNKEWNDFQRNPW